MNEAQVTLVGYVASAPALVMTKTGRFVTNMRVGVTPRRQDRLTGQWSDGDTSYLTVTCWRSLASNAAACLRKGDPVVVKGRMRVRQYEGKDGNPRLAVEVEASTLGHDLTRGVAHFLRTKHSHGDAPADATGEHDAAGPHGDQPADGWQDGDLDILEPAAAPGDEFSAADLFDDAGIDAGIDVSSAAAAAADVGGGAPELAEGDDSRDGTGIRQVAEAA